MVVDVKEDVIYTAEADRERIYQFLEGNPTIDELGKYLADVATYFCCEINETLQWEIVNKQQKFSIDDFKNDVESLIKEFGEVLVSKWNIKRWVYTPRTYQN